MSLTQIFDELSGTRIPGGCNDCNAYQTAANDPDHPWWHHVYVHHDDDCPAYRAMGNRRERRARRARGAR